MELRKLNLQDAYEQWEYTTALPEDENGLTNSFHGVGWEKYRGKGYATKGLELTLEIARTIVPEDEIYLRLLN